MNDKQIECFLSVAELKNYTRASEKLYLTQPTISRYVANLEDELHCTLFRRTTKKVELTEAGEMYYKLFSKWKFEFDQTVREIQNLIRIKKCKIRFGYLEGWIMPRRFSEFCIDLCKEYPEFDIELKCLSFQEMIDGLMENDLDLALMIETPYVEKYQLQYQKVAEISKAIVYAANHPLADKPDLKPDDFKDEIFFALDDEFNYAVKFMKECCASYHFVPTIRAVDNIQTINANVQNGMGVMINDDWGPGCNKEFFSTLPIDAKTHVWLVWKDGYHAKEKEIFIQKISNL